MGKILENMESVSQSLKARSDFISPVLNAIDRESNRAETLGSIKRGTHVRVWLQSADGEDEMKLAKVVESAVVSSLKTEKGTEQKRFKYYISLLNQNRRLDRWIEQSNLIGTVEEDDEELMSAFEVQSKQELSDAQHGYFKNDENKGMD